MGAIAIIIGVICIIMGVAYTIWDLKVRNQPISEKDFILGITDLAAKYHAEINVPMTEHDEDIITIVIHVKEKVVVFDTFTYE